MWQSMIGIGAACAVATAPAATAAAEPRKVLRLNDVMARINSPSLRTRPPASPFTRNESEAASIYHIKTSSASRKATMKPEVRRTLKHPQNNLLLLLLSANRNL